MIKIAAWVVNLTFLVLPFAIAALVYLPFERRILRSLDFASKITDETRHRWLEHHRSYASRQERIAFWLALLAFAITCLLVSFIYANWHAIGREISSMRDY